MTFIGFTILFIQRFKYILLMWVLGLLWLAIEEKWRRKDEVEKE